LEDRDPIGPAGDVRYRPLNMGILGEADPDPDEESDEPASNAAAAVPA